MFLIHDGAEGHYDSVSDSVSNSIACVNRPFLMQCLSNNCLGDCWFLFQNFYTEVAIIWWVQYRHVRGKQLCKNSQGLLEKHIQDKIVAQVVKYEGKDQELLWPQYCRNLTKMDSKTLKSDTDGITMPSKQ